MARGFSAATVGHHTFFSSTTMPFSDVKAVSDELMFMGSKYGGDGPAAAPPADYTGTVGTVDGGMFRALVANGYTQLARNKDELCAPSGSPKHTRTHIAFLRPARPTRRGPAYAGARRGTACCPQERDQRVPHPRRRHGQQHEDLPAQRRAEPGASHDRPAGVCGIRDARRVSARAGAEGLGRVGVEAVREARSVIFHAWRAAAVRADRRPAGRGRPHGGGHAHVRPGQQRHGALALLHLARQVIAGVAGDRINTRGRPGRRHRALP